MKATIISIVLTSNPNRLRVSLRIGDHASSYHATVVSAQNKFGTIRGIHYDPKLLKAFHPDTLLIPALTKAILNVHEGKNVKMPCTLRHVADSRRSSTAGSPSNKKIPRDVAVAV